MEEVTVCIPAKNEESVILPTLDAIIEMCDAYPNFSWRVVVVDNGSDDDTAGFVQSYNDSRVTLLTETTPGKGAAIIAGVRACTSDYFAYVDADLSANPFQIPALLEYVKAGVDIAVGSRLINTTIVNRSLWRTVTAKIFSGYASYLVPVSVLDSQCPLKVMNTSGQKILASCIDTGWFFDRELLAKAHKRGLTIKEVPIFWEEFRYPDRKSKLHVVRAGLQSIVSLWRIRKEVNKF